MAMTIKLLHDTGTSKTDKITNDATLTGTGAVPNGQVVIYDDTSGTPVAVGTVTASASGTWTFTPPTSTLGGYTYYAASGPNTTSDLAITYIPPGTVTIALQNGTPPGGTSNSDVLVGTAAPNASVLIYQNTALVGAATADHNGNWTYTPASLSPGLASFSAYDAAGNYAPISFTYAPCYLRGTRLRTPEGWAKVEDLAEGDLVLTADGGSEAVRWVGRRSHRRDEALGNPKILPVLIREGAFAEAVPCRDLYVSPDHAVLVDGVLAHAGALVNGTSILRSVPDVTEVAYFHVELDRHALLLAEDLPAESFVDNTNRSAFDNWDAGDATPAVAMAEMDLPRAKSWRQVPRAARERLDARGEALFGAATQAA